LFRQLYSHWFVFAAAHPQVIFGLEIAAAAVIGFVCGQLIGGGNCPDLPDPTWWQRCKTVLWQVGGAMTAAAAVAISNHWGVFEYVIGLLSIIFRWAPIALA